MHIAQGGIIFYGGELLYVFRQLLLEWIFHQYSYAELDYILSQYSYVNIYFIKIRMHSFRNYFIPLCIVSRYFMYLRDSWFFVFVFFPCENWVIRFSLVISHGRSYQQYCCTRTWDFQRIHQYPKYISNRELKKFLFKINFRLWTRTVKVIT